MERLMEYGSISKEAADLLKTLVAARYNIFVSGGTGAGKTTLLNALSEFIPSGERVITIEDAAELQLSHIENLVRLETRDANAEGAGAIGIGELIRAALRMRRTGLSWARCAEKRRWTFCRVSTRAMTAAFPAVMRTV